MRIGGRLSVADVVSVARDRGHVALSVAARERMARSSAHVARIVESGERVYGVNTGFGALADVSIPADRLVELQRNLVRSHASGAGDPLPEEVVRGAMLLAANSFGKGLSGVRPAVAQSLIAFLNRGVTPLVPEHGSLGASGDLAPLAHIALVLIGEGEAIVQRRRVSGKQALRIARLKPLTLRPKEGLALVNGTHVSASMAALAVHDAAALLRQAHLAAAASFEALLAHRAPLDSRIHRARPHRGQQESAALLRSLLQGSALLDSVPHVQDPYSLRCAPQVLGASLAALHHATRVVETELNSVTDNPLFFDGALSGGNFHGQPLALVLDYLAIALAEAASIAERRVALLMDKHHSRGLPAFLAGNPGRESGFMVAHYTAASLVSESKILCHPASVDSIPTSAGQEDHVSMSLIAGRKCLRVLENTRSVVAIELLAALQGVELRDGKPGRGVSAALKTIRRDVPPLRRDRSLAPDIEKARGLMRAGRL